MQLFNVIPMPVFIVLLAIFVIMIIVIAINYLKQKSMNEIRGDVYQFILEAEHIYSKSSAGQQKLKWVVSKARLLLPKWLQVFISEETLMKVIDIWFLEVKDLLDDGKVNGSQK